MHFLFFWGPLPFFCAFGGSVAPAYVKKGATFANFRYLDFVGHFSHLTCCLWGEAPLGDLPLLSFCTKPPACQGRAAGALVLALTGRGRSATAARRRRNTPGGTPAQGPSAPERASRPEGEGRAGQGEASARRTGTRQDQEHRARQRGRPAIQNVDFVGHTCPTKSPPRFV